MGQVSSFAGKPRLYLQVMIKPVQKAPKAFAERYNRIVDGDETIDTITKLKEFWLFAIEQGRPHPEMREYIARFVHDVPTSKLVNSMIFSDYNLHESHTEFVGFRSVGESQNPEVSDNELHDTIWQNIADHVAAINETELDKKIESLNATPQLNQKQIEEFLDSYTAKK